MTTDTSAQQSCAGPNKVTRHKPMTRIPYCIATWCRNAVCNRMGIQNGPSWHAKQLEESEEKDVHPVGQKDKYIHFNLWV